MILTFAQWRSQLINERVAEYGCTRSDAAYGIAHADWWTRHVQPNLKAGNTLSWPVLRSLVDHGYRLVWIEKHYPGSVPQYCDIRTGRQLPRGLK